MNDDRALRPSSGETLTNALEQRAQRQVSWLCSQARGEDILDIGCGNGDISILLGREGFRVTGIDIDPSRIERASTDLELEPSEVRDRVRFDVASGSILDLEDDSFDTVILGEVLEHLTVPDRLLREIQRVLKPGGVVAITAPFGSSADHDTVQTFYPARLWYLIDESLHVRSLTVVDDHFRVVAEAPVETHLERRPVDPGAFEALDDVWSAVDADLQASRTRVADLERQNRDLGTQVDRQAGEIPMQAIEIVDQAERLLDMAGQLSKAAIVIDRQRQRIGRVEHDRTKLRDRLALSEWKLASTTSRKWWRIGAAIGRVRSNLLRVFVLPLDIVRIVNGSSNLPPRPQPTQVGESVIDTGGSDLDDSTDSGTDLESRSIAFSMYLAQGSASRGRDSALVPMAVVAPSSMSLAPPPITTTRDLRVASILDDMSHQSFAPECHLISFSPQNWFEVLERERPNILLVESAWRGNSGSWEYKVGSYSYPESVSLPDLAAVVEWCRREGVPTVFWNKEDPIHFEKFKEAAALFDVVFTTDEDMVERYQDLSGMPNRVVGVLPFAAQPMIHNPVGMMHGRDPRPVFAGAYYRNRHESRKAQLELLLDAAMPFDLMIYDRMGGAVSDSFGFPERFLTNIEGTLPYEEMVRAYRSQRVFLNVNSVSGSPTMFSRRVFELLASGTPVVSTPSVGIEQMFGGIVDIVETQREASDAITRLIEDDDWWLDRSVRGIESVFRSHTYADRLHTIAQAAGLSVESPQPSVSVVVGANGAVSAESLASTGNLADVFSLTDLDFDESAPGVPRIHQINALLDRDMRGVIDTISNTTSADWLAFVNSDADIRAVGSLTTATRIVPAEIYVPAATWAGGHEFVHGPDATGVSLASMDFVRRSSWTPWGASGGSSMGARVYSVPVVDG